jgi:glucan phosphoethanolaminetransferase (alkaline phosphatase superfamily)
VNRLSGTRARGVHVAGTCLMHADRTEAGVVRPAGRLRQEHLGARARGMADVRTVMLVARAMVCMLPTFVHALSTAVLALAVAVRAVAVVALVVHAVAVVVLVLHVLAVVVLMVHTLAIVILVVHALAIVLVTTAVTIRHVRVLSSVRARAGSMLRHVVHVIAVVVLVVHALAIVLVTATVTIRHVRVLSSVRARAGGMMRHVVMSAVVRARDRQFAHERRRNRDGLTIDSVRQNTPLYLYETDLRHGSRKRRKRREQSGQDDDARSNHAG